MHFFVLYKFRSKIHPFVYAFLLYVNFFAGLGFGLDQVSSPIGGLGLEADLKSGKFEDLDLDFKSSFTRTSNTLMFE